MGHFATGVAVVTSRTSEGDPCGATANAVASVSLEPPLVLVCLATSSVTHGCVLENGVFAINVLDAGAGALARRFSRGRRATRFEGLELDEQASGSPVLADALAWLDCRIEAIHPAGDHAIVVGRVLACDARAGDPLVFFRSGFREVAP